MVRTDLQVSDECFLKLSIFLLSKLRRSASDLNSPGEISKVAFAKSTAAVVIAWVLNPADVHQDHPF
jgi:hypothetical protein